VILPTNVYHCVAGWPHNKLLEKTLYLQVIDYDRFSRDDPIGETYIPLNEVDLSQSPLMWKYLAPCKDSRVRIACVIFGGGGGGEVEVE